jgi:alanyl-tRNA synthetase
MPPSGSQVRQKFIDFFVARGHRHVHSSSLVPANDPTLLFTNAGMNQFKDVFLGIEKRDYKRATTSQKCVRAGGKHNDLENVGFTKRHHTFFEMLGNFSFGDYFKREAIAFAWELVTSPEWWGIPKEKLYATIFKGEEGVPRDDDAYNFWREQGVPAERVFELGMKENFWAMGDTGPCGPCSEIHFDIGPAASDEGHADCKFPCDCGRYVEIWNLVFMQFDRDATGTLNPLPKPCVDTGAGLERVTAVLQGVISNYDTDLFTPLTKRAAELTGVDVKKELEAEQHARSAASLRVIADHARATTFLIADGVLPSNEGRGYVLRKIMRRAIRHGHLLGQEKPFLFQMVHAVRDLMGTAYPELIEAAEQVAKVVYEEERRFAHTLDIGLKRLDEDLAPLVAAKRANPAARAMYSGEKAFKLYDTFGLPFDFMTDAAHDAGISFDTEGFERAMAAQRERARASWKGAAQKTASPAFRELRPTIFEGYKQTESTDCEVIAIIDPETGQGVRELKAGQRGEIVLDHTPFYSEAGGQVGDVGWLHAPSSRALVADVTGCYYPVAGVRAHRVVAKQPIVVGDKVDAVVNLHVREQTMRHHTGTHLLHAALREVLGKHVKQAGSLVDPGHLRFDFSHFASVADEDLQDIEDLMNREVLRNTRVEVIEDVPIDVAVNEYKAMALFGEKYGERVRVIKIGGFSTELCGGTHTAATGEIGLIKVLHEGSVSAGVRRVEAVAGEASLRHFRRDHQLEHVVSSFVKTADAALAPAEALKAELEKREAEVRRLQKELEQARMKSAASATQNIGEKVREVKGVKVLSHRADNLERPQLRTLVDNLRNKLGSGVVVIGSNTDGKVALIVGVTKDLTDRVPAGKVVAAVAQKVGGKGGGRPDLAEAGGSEPGALDSALDSAYGVVEQLLG